MSFPSLNLINFEVPQQTRNCRYILTSPRSLKACKKAGVKPIELLYKSLSEVEKKYGKVKKAQEQYQIFEKERQRKLALCRKLRNDFILMGLLGKVELNRGQLNMNFNTKVSVSTENSDIEGISKESPVVTERTSLKMTENLPMIVPCQEILENENAIKTERINEKINSLIPSISPSSIGDKNTIELKSPASITKDRIPNNINNNKFYTNSPENVFLDKISKEKLSTPDSLMKIPDSINDDESLSREKLPIIDVDRKNVHFEDVNNNHQVEKIFNHLEKRPSSSNRKKIKDKKKLKAIECERLFQNICDQYSDPEYCLFKYRQVIENSLDRELKEQEVQRVQRELEEGLERWQDDVLLVQWLDTLRAQQKATKELEMKVERLQRSARSKNILHTMNYNKVQKDEDIKMELLRRFIENKEKRISKLHKQRDRVIVESKTRAQTVSDLKQQVRDIMTPETFDKTVLKSGIERKVMNTRAMCPRIMQKSNFRLA